MAGPTRHTPSHLPRRRNRALWIALAPVRFVADLTRFLLYTAVFFGLMVLASYWVVGKYIKVYELPAPKVTGMALKPALELLGKDDLSLKLDRAQPHNAVPRGIIISQFPEPGSRIKAGTPVRVVLSDGAPLVTVPKDLAGTPRITAGLRLRKLGLEVGNIAYLPREGVAGGIILLATDPPGGTGVVQKSAVNLLVAAGEDQTMKQMPSLKGLTLADARETLEQYGLKASEEVEIDAPASVATEILDQEPAPGTPLEPLMHIKLTYATGPAEEMLSPNDAVTTGSADTYLGDEEVTPISSRVRDAWGDEGGEAEESEAPPVDLGGASPPANPSGE